MKQSELNKWRRYFAHRETGLGIEASARRAHLGVATAYRFEHADPTSGGLDAAALLGITSVAGNLLDAPLSTEAGKALQDFAYFRRRYFGRVSTPWQERAAYDVLGALTSPDREYLVINCPPGSGKSTLFTCDLVCWLIARDRTIRIQVGSRTGRQARMYVGRVKRALERDAPIRADADSLAHKIGFDADAVLQDDFGAFKPEGRSDKWTGEELVVRQLDGVSLDDKEPTVSAWGQDTGFLGGRFDLVVWDDLVDRKNTRTADARAALADWYSEEAESRLEPGGVLLLQGQRMNPGDQYRVCLDSTTALDAKKYRHVVYQAHDESKCTGEHHGPPDRAGHPTLLPPWPQSCLLDPHRLPWEFLQTIKKNNPRTFEIQYQQTDGKGSGTFVDAAWIYGNVDRDGWLAPGCLDPDRGTYQVPVHLLDGRGWTLLSIDPSPENYWGIILWVFDPDTNNRYIIDIVRRRLGPQDVLGVDKDTATYTGIMEQMRVAMSRLRAPLHTVIFEQNAAQRWFLQMPHVQQWVDATGVRIVGHTTSTNKADPKFGVESIADLFKQGLIRIPDHGLAARTKSAPYLVELLTYPDGDTDDLIMSTWFAHLACTRHYQARRRDAQYQVPVPGWIARPGGRAVSRGLPWAM